MFYIAILFTGFGNFQKIEQIWTLGPLSYYRNTLNDKKRIYECVWEIFVLYIWESTNSQNDETHVRAFVKNKHQHEQVTKLGK